MALGAVTTAQGIGASLSTMLAGVMVVEAGCASAFLALAAIAAAGLALFWFAMPETAEELQGARAASRLPAAPRPAE